MRWKWSNNKENWWEIERRENEDGNEGRGKKMEEREQETMMRGEWIRDKGMEERRERAKKKMKEKN